MDLLDLFVNGALASSIVVVFCAVLEAIAKWQVSFQHFEEANFIARKFWFPYCKNNTVLFRWIKFYRILVFRIPCFLKSVSMCAAIGFAVAAVLHPNARVTEFNQLFLILVGVSLLSLIRIYLLSKSRSTAILGSSENKAYLFIACVTLLAAILVLGAQFAETSTTDQDVQDSWHSVITWSLWCLNAGFIVMAMSTTLQYTNFHVVFLGDVLSDEANALFMLRRGGRFVSQQKYLSPEAEVLLPRYESLVPMRVSEAVKRAGDLLANRSERDGRRPEQDFFGVLPSNEEDMDRVLNAKVGKRLKGLRKRVMLFVCLSWFVAVVQGVVCLVALGHCVGLISGFGAFLADLSSFVILLHQSENSKQSYPLMRAVLLTVSTRILLAATPLPFWFTGICLVVGLVGSIMAWELARVCWRIEKPLVSTSFTPESSGPEELSQIPLSTLAVSLLRDVGVHSKFSFSSTIPNWSLPMVILVCCCLYLLPLSIAVVLGTNDEGVAVLGECFPELPPLVHSTIPLKTIPQSRFGGLSGVLVGSVLILGFCRSGYLVVRGRKYEELRNKRRRMQQTTGAMEHNDLANQNGGGFKGAKNRKGTLGHRFKPMVILILGIATCAVCAPALYIDFVLFQEQVVPVTGTSASILVAIVSTVALRRSWLEHDCEFWKVLPKHADFAMLYGVEALSMYKFLHRRILFRNLRQVFYITVTALSLSCTGLSLHFGWTVSWNSSIIVVFEMVGVILLAFAAEQWFNYFGVNYWLLAGSILCHCGAIASAADLLWGVQSIDNTGELLLMVLLLVPGTELLVFSLYKYYDSSWQLTWGTRAGFLGASGMFVSVGVWGLSAFEEFGLFVFLASLFAAALLLVAAVYYLANSQALPPALDTSGPTTRSRHRQWRVAYRVLGSGLAVALLVLGAFESSSPVFPLYPDLLGGFGYVIASVVLVLILTLLEASTRVVRYHRNGTVLVPSVGPFGWPVRTYVTSSHGDAAVQQAHLGFSPGMLLMVAVPYVSLASSLLDTADRPMALGVAGTCLMLSVGAAVLGENARSNEFRHLVLACPTRPSRAKLFHSVVVETVRRLEEMQRRIAMNRWLSENEAMYRDQFKNTKRSEQKKELLASIDAERSKHAMEIASREGVERAKVVFYALFSLRAKEHISHFRAQRGDRGEKATQYTPPSSNQSNFLFPPPKSVRFQKPQAYSQLRQRKSSLQRENVDTPSIADSALPRFRRTLSEIGGRLPKLGNNRMRAKISDSSALESTGEEEEESQVNKALLPKVWENILESEEEEGEESVVEKENCLHEPYSSFIDLEFPPGNSALFADWDDSDYDPERTVHDALAGSQDEMRTDMEGAIWCRPPQLFPEEVSKLTGIYPSVQLSTKKQYLDATDVVQGQVGDCWLLSAMSLVALRQDLMDKILCTKNVRASGQYKVRLFLDGKYHTITVDDWVPCHLEQRRVFTLQQEVLSEHHFSFKSSPGNQAEDVHHGVEDGQNTESWFGRVHAMEDDVVPSLSFESPGEMPRQHPIPAPSENLNSTAPARETTHRLVTASQGGSDVLSTNLSLHTVETLPSSPQFRLERKFHVEPDSSIRSLLSRSSLEDGPVQDSENQRTLRCLAPLPLYAKSKAGPALWMTLVEKAFAKYYGCYEALEGGHVHSALMDLTGGFAQLFALHDDPAVALPQALWARLQTALDTGSLVAVGSPAVGPEDEVVEDGDQSWDANGIMHGHAYAVIRVVKERDSNGSHRLLQLRDPWAEAKWCGPWCKSDTKRWTRRMRAKLGPYGGVGEKDDDVFWISLEDFLASFQWLYVCNLFDKDKWFHYSCQGSWALGTAGGPPNSPTAKLNPQFTLKPTVSRIRSSWSKEFTVFISLSSSPLAKEDNWEQPPSRELYPYMALYVLDVGGSCIPNVLGAEQVMASSGTFKDSRDVSLQVTLPVAVKGGYTILPCLYSAGEMANFRITIYSDYPCSVTQLDVEQDGE